MTVAYPGPPGAHSEAACARLFPLDPEPAPLASFTAVAEAVAGERAQFGVLPIESTLSGPVAETHDLLYDSPLSIVSEAILPIRHCLVGVRAVPLEQLRVIRSHAVALDQCRSLLARLPQATAIAAATTADAAAEVARRGDPAEAAIASERAARQLGLTVLVDDAGDRSEAYTRFVGIATATRLDDTGGEWRTALSFNTDHRPGALCRAIEPLERGRIDLVQLVSRPLPAAPWRYRFDAVLAGHPATEGVRTTLREMRLRTHALRVFGSYPAEGASRARWGGEG